MCSTSHHWRDPGSWQLERWAPITKHRAAIIERPGSRRLA
jgi:hypothetical protein